MRKRRHAARDFRHHAARALRGDRLGCKELELVEIVERGRQGRLNGLLGFVVLVRRRLLQSRGRLCEIRRFGFGNRAPRAASMFGRWMTACWHVPSPSSRSSCSPTGAKLSPNERPDGSMLKPPSAKRQQRDTLPRDRRVSHIGECDLTLDAPEACWSATCERAYTDQSRSVISSFSRRILSRPKRIDATRKAGLTPARGLDSCTLKSTSFVCRNILGASIVRS